MSDKKITKPLDLEHSVMTKVRANEITMRPRWFFVVGSLAKLVGLTASAVMLLYLVNLSLFLLRDHGPMGEWRLQQILASFPLYVPLLAMVGVATGIWLLKKYDFAYKRNFLFIVTLCLIAILLSGLILDTTGLSDIFLRRGPARGMYQQNHNTNSRLQREDGLRRRDDSGSENGVSRRFEE